MKTFKIQKCIVEVAFDIANSEGFKGISIRKVADKVGCSIAPIYVNFKDIDELKMAVVEKVKGIIKKLITDQKSGEHFLDIGIASVKFAKEYSVIYRELILSGNTHISENSDDFKAMLINEMKKDVELKDFTDEELKIILMKMKIFQVGLSIMATEDGFAEELTEDKIIELLKDSGTDVILGMKYRKNKFQL